MTLDIDRWLPYLDSRDLSSRQKQELIRAIWSIMESAADQAFGLHPVQQSRGYADISNLQSHAQQVDSKGSPIAYCFGKAANDNEYSEETSAYEEKKQA